MPLPIVAIGASAGGLEAISEFLWALPTKSEMAFQPNQVYVIPPNCVLTLSEDRFRLDKPEFSSTPQNAIDTGCVDFVLRPGRTANSLG